MGRGIDECIYRDMIDADDFAWVDGDTNKSQMQTQMQIYYHSCRFKDTYKTNRNTKTCSKTHSIIHNNMTLLSHPIPSIQTPPGITIIYHPCPLIF